MALKRNVYNNWTELQKSIDSGGGPVDTYTKAQIDAKLNDKQDNLTAGTNIIINDNIISARLDNYTTKMYVDNADTTLQTNINNEATERTAADNTITTNLNTEIANRTNADTDLDNKKQDKLSAGTGIEITDNVVKATLINDAEKSSVKTYSSEKIQALLDALSGRATIKVVDTQPADPEANTLYYIGTASPYDIMLYSNNIWYDMGTTEVDLSNYYKKTETYSQEQIDDKVTFLTNSVTTEKTNRTDADTNLQTQITANDADIETNKGNIEINKTNITTNTTNITTNTNNIATNTADITDLKNDKQDKLTAGDGINITSNTIKAQVKKLKVGPDETENTMTGDGTVTLPHLYIHFVKLGNPTTSSVLSTTAIFTNDATPFTYATLTTWLTNNGCVSTLTAYGLTCGQTGTTSFYCASSSGGSTTQQKTCVTNISNGIFFMNGTLYTKTSGTGKVTWAESEWVADQVFKIY